jgi:hypothetical protein
MSSERGMDLKDGPKNMRDRARYNIAYSKDVDMRRPDTFRNNPKDIGKLKGKTPVISNRGSDLKDQVLEGRKKAQYNKSNSGFMRFTTPVDTKIQQGTYF